MHKVFKVIRSVRVNIEVEEIASVNPLVAVHTVDRLIDYDQLLRQRLPEDLVLSVEFDKLEGATVYIDGSDFPLEYSEEALGTCTVRGINLKRG